jgi:hypothetical protein
LVRRPAAASGPTHALFAAQSHSIVDNLVALLRYRRALDCSPVNCMRLVLISRFTAGFWYQADTLSCPRPSQRDPNRTKRGRGTTPRFASPGRTWRPRCELDQSAASVTSGHTNRAAVAEKSIGAPTFDLTGAPVASGADKHPGRRSSELRQ